MRVLMTGGGTAGHVNPAIAIANTIKKKQMDATIAFVCSSQTNDKAITLVPHAGYGNPYKIDICGMYKIWNPKNLKTLYLMMKSRKQARRIIEEFKPDVIIGTGGFACYPLLRAGVDMGIPTLVHESNAIPGKAVMRLATLVDCVMTNFESAHLLKGAKKVIKVGNPNLVEPVIEKKRDNKKSVLIFGGSRGAMNLNTEVISVLEEIAEKYPEVEFCHGTGSGDFARVNEEYANRGLDKRDNIQVLEYIYDMSDRMNRATVVVCRAGAMTISELALCHKAAVIVPSPYVAANHQYKNAKALSDKDACILVEESQYGSGELKRAIVELLENNERRCTLEKNIAYFAVADANEVIYNEIMSTVGSK